MSSCGDKECKCTYCNNDNYDRYIGDHMRECLDNINRFLSKPVEKLNDADEERFYQMIMYQSQMELAQLKKLKDLCIEN